MPNFNKYIKEELLGAIVYKFRSYVCVKIIENLICWDIFFSLLIKKLCGCLTFCFHGSPFDQERM